MSEHPLKAIQFIYDIAPGYAKAQSDYDHLCEYRKALKATLMLASEASSAVMKEAEALSSPEYMKNLQGAKVAQERAITFKWQLEAAKLKVEVWRSESANNRAMDRAAA